MATIKIEGQTINGDSVGITDEIANDDDLLKAALAPTWPDVRTATINRSGGTDGKELVVTVTKKAGTKGVDNVIEVEEAQERLAELEEDEVMRVRALEDIALAAFEYLQLPRQYEGADVARLRGRLGELEVALETLGADEIARMKSERRRA